MQWAANYPHDVTKESKTTDEFACAMDTFRDILQEASEFCDDEVNQQLLYVANEISQFNSKGLCGTLYMNRPSFVC